MNNKGFTLVELLAVLVILSVIMGIAIPTISSSMERTKSKQDKTKQKMLESYAEMFVTDNKNAVYTKLGTSGTECHITLSMLEKYLSDDAMKDANGNQFNGYILFTRANGSLPPSYKYVSGAANNSKLCV